MNPPSSEPPARWNTGPIAWMARNHIAANLLMIIVLGGGIWSAFTIQKEVYPPFELDIVEVRVRYPGADPSEVEQGILLPIEEIVKGLQGIKEMTSTAREGRGTVRFELVPGTDRMKAFQDIEQAISRIRTFAEDIEKPEVTLQVRQRDVMEISLFGEVEVWTLRQLAERLRDRLLSDPRITQVELRRVPAYVTHVEIPQHRLREHNLTLGQVARIIEQSSRDVPAGSVATAKGEILLRMKDRKQWAADLGQIPVITSDQGARVLLSDLADIRDGFEEIGFHSQFNRQPAVGIEIFRVGDQSPLAIADAVQSIMDEFAQSLPPGVHHRIDGNRAKDYQDRLFLLLKNGAIGIVIVLLILSVFLEFRLAFWVMMGMVISFAGGLMFLPLVDISINMISMFAFLVVLGIVVDDAIVMGENIHEYRQRKMGPLLAAKKGAREIAGPVIFSILTNIVAFVPLMFLPGTTGKFWWPLPVVVVVVFAVSLLEALFILPAHLGHAESGALTSVGRLIHRWQQGFAGAFNRLVNRQYRALLSVCLRHRYVTLSVAITLLAVVGGYGYSDHMGLIMMPEAAVDEIECGVSLPVGTTVDQAAKTAIEVTEATHRMFEKHNLSQVAEGIKTNVRGRSFVDVEIVLKPPDERDMTAPEVIELWRNEIGDIEGVDQITFETESGPGGWRDDISVDLSHGDIDVLERASQAFMARAKRFEATRDVNDNYNRGKVQFDFTLLPEGRNLGLTSAAVGRQVRDAFFGAVALRQLRGTNEIEIRVKLPEAERKSLHHLENFVVRTAEGAEVPLLEVVEVSRTEAFTSINRRNGRRVVTVGMDVEPKRAMGQVMASFKNEALPRLVADFPGITWQFEGTQAEMRESTQTLWGGFALAMAIVYALLAIAFGSYVQPLIVMFAIPFGIVGAVLGHILLGFDLSLVSLMGVIALSGVVVNDALIMIHYANKKRSAATAFDAIRQAGIRRFRPIVLTTLTTFGGLTPIILETSRQAIHLIPMAISLGFGIIFATAIILVIVPCLYLILEDVLSLLRVR